MQSPPGRRALSGLASKLHPQLPLSNRQSQHLLTLLTTSFRDHLDREHPVAAPDPSTTKLALPPPPSPSPHSTPARAESSHSSASSHLESILTNPLFATRPRRRGSNPSDIREALQDPLSWFNAEIAAGTANIHTAISTLEMLWRAAAQIQPGTPQRLHSDTKPGTRMAEWLRYSGQDTSTEFVERFQLISKLVPLLLEEGKPAPIWRWFKHSPESRMKETGLDAARVLAFRVQVLKLMVTSKLASEPTMDQALAIFIRAFKYLDTPEYGLTSKVLQPTGAILVRHILANPATHVAPELYHFFLHSSSVWAGSWSAAIQSILWLHHPSKATAGPGLSYLRDPKGAALHLRGASPTRRKLLVQLCLGVAQRLVQEHSLAEAQIAIAFARDNFPDLVLSKVATTDHHSESHAARVREQGNLHLLDQLLPG
ncbi:hypothetical protein K505DRAFT_330922 [Melanomma pulvis-pyrius CBS 109.77]|uniref:Uncharacterized protein n=1 Tax=Melanomma pulvis-pyrius CBS 109.77 TaxID=1314802 RepID=A0A6A6WNQ3_9PLEO|nr:hypothetical protein K505DRAFT_330922 [Melanomma pulvis-pyrius CBS 109.77]